MDERDFELASPGLDLGRSHLLGLEGGVHPGDKKVIFGSCLDDAGTRKKQIGKAIADRPEAQFIAGF